MSEYSVYYKGVFQGVTEYEDKIYEWAKYHNIFDIMVYKDNDFETPPPIHFNSVRDWIVALINYVSFSKMNEFRLTDEDFEL